MRIANKKYILKIYHIDPYEIIILFLIIRLLLKIDDTFSKTDYR